MAENSYSSWKKAYEEAGFNDDEVQCLLATYKDDIESEEFQPAVLRKRKQPNTSTSQRRRGPDKKPRKRRCTASEVHYLNEPSDQPEAISAPELDTDMNTDLDALESVPDLLDLDDLMDHSATESESDQEPTLSRHALRTKAAHDQWESHKESLLEAYLMGWKAILNHKPIPRLRNVCSACDDDESTGSAAAIYSTETIKLVSLNGVNDAELELQWCCHSSKPQPVDAMYVGLFPFSPASFTTFVEFELIRFMSRLLDYSPVSSVSVMAAVLSSLGQDILRRDGLIAIMNQWRDLEFEERKLIQGDLFRCPSCPGGGHCVHIDGNFKLYRYTSQGRAQGDQCIKNDSFIAQDASVDQHLKALNYQSTSERDNVCGGTWRAARNQPLRKSSKIDETGLDIASCRHDVALKAVNMHRGEIFPYPLYLQFPCAAFIAMDVICKYYPWLSKSTEYHYLTQKQRPMLSEMHAKAHSWTCQLTWSARNQQGAGLSTGESTEHVNAYLSRHGITTRQMSKSNRISRLTQAASHWNTMKTYRLPHQLYSMFLKARKIINENCDQIVELEHKAQLINFHRPTTDPTMKAVEVNSANCQRIHQQITRVGDSSKMRFRLKSKLTKAEKKLQTSILELLNVHSHFRQEEIQVACRSGIFPWTTGDVDDSNITFNEALEAHEKVNCFKRAQEEMKLLEKEHSNAVEYFTSLSQLQPVLPGALAEKASLLELVQNHRVMFCGMMLKRLEYYKLPSL